MSKVNGAFFMKNKKGASLSTILNNNGTYECLIVSVVNKENENQEFDFDHPLTRLSIALDRAEILQLDVDIYVNETTHELTADIDNCTYKVMPTTLTLY